MAINFFREEPDSYANSSDIMKDLNMTFIVRNIANENYGDAPYIAEVLQHPLRREEDIKHRQQLIGTACQHEGLISELRRIIVELSHIHI